MFNNMYFNNISTTNQTHNGIKHYAQLSAIRSKYLRVNKVIVN